jgi:hypothetical protein
MQRASTVAYQVPRGFAVPSRSHGQYTTRNISDHLAEILRGRAKQRTVLMARSSALNEDHTPGKNPTHLSVFDPENPELGRAQFLENVERLLRLSPDMGVLVMPMVGKEEDVLDESGKSHSVIGHSNLSFYGTTHSPFHVGQASFSLCHGLGNTAAFHTDQSMPVIAMRESGHLVFLGNMTEAYGSYSPELPKVTTHEQYRQQQLFAFDFNQSELAQFSTVGLFAGLRELTGVLSAGRGGTGRFLSFANWEDDQDAQQALDYARLLGNDRISARNFGKVPFTDSGQLRQLIKLAKILGRNEAFQFEGTFASGADGVPYVYQLLSLPQRHKTNQPIDLDPIHYSTTDCFGSIDFSGPLILMEATPTNLLPHLQELDRRFAHSGYTLFSQIQNEEILAATPNCRVRLSYWGQDMGSHVLTSLWLKHTQEVPGNFAMASGLGGAPEIEFFSPSSIAGFTPGTQDHEHHTHIFTRVRVQANGERLVLQVVTP